MTVNFNYDNKTIFSGIKLPSEEEKPKTIFSGIKLPEEDYAVKHKYDYPYKLTSAVQSGFHNLIGGSFAAPEVIAGTLYDAAAFPQNVIANKFNIPGLEAHYSDIAKSKYNPLKYTTDISRVLKQKAAELSPTKDFEEGIIESAVEGNYLQAGELLSYAIAENLPQYLFIAISSAAGVPQAGLGMIGGSAAGGKYMDLEDSGLDDETRRLNAMFTGTAEVAFESVSTLPRFEKIFSNKTVRDQVKTGFFKTFKPLVKNALEEAFEEGGTQVTENLVDMFTGVKEKPKDFKDFIAKATEGVPDAALVGGVMGTGMGLVDTHIESKARKQTIQQQKQNLQIIKDAFNIINEQSLNTPAEYFYGDDIGPVIPKEVLNIKPTVESVFDVTTDEDLTNVGEKLNTDVLPIEALQKAVQPEPVQRLQEVELIDKGKVEKIITPDDTEIETQFGVIDINNVITSHDINLKENPLFPKEAQPRDRSKSATEEQIQNIYNRLDPERLAENRLAAHGAPIIGSDGVVETGNARTIALQRLYKDNHQNIENYKNWLIENAERFGLNPEKIRQIENPILVRERLTDIDRQRFTQEANVGETARMSVVEQGAVDAQRLSDDLLRKFAPHEEGEINTKNNQEFITGFLEEVVGTSQKGQYVDAQGLINQDGIKRIQSAIFMKAYNNTDLAQELLESTDNAIKNITGAMMDSASKMVDVKRKIEKGNFPDLNISNELVEAVNIYKHAKATAGSMDSFLRTQSLFGDNYSELGTKVAQIFDDNKRSRKRIKEVLNNYLNGVEGLDVRTDMNSMFDDFVKEPPTKLEMLEAAYEKMARGYKNVNTEKIFGESQDTLFTGQGEQVLEDRATDIFNDNTGEESGTLAYEEPGKINTDDTGNHYVKSNIDGKDYNVYVDAAIGEPDYVKYGSTAIELPEIIRIAKTLNEGEYPHIVKKFRDITKKGHFVYKGDEGKIELRADIFIGPVEETIEIDSGNRDMVLDYMETAYPGEDYKITTFEHGGKNYARAYKIDPTYAAKVIAHEIGHLNDWMPDKTMLRGNILGRIANLNNYMKNTLNDPELGTLDRNRITEELKKLSMEWKPFDPYRDMKFTKYRYSSKELYADAVSVLLNNPDMLKTTAPTFYDAFIKYLDKKPEFKAIYNDIMDKRESRKEYAMDTSSDRMIAYQKGLEKRIEMLREDMSLKEKGTDWLLRGLVSKNHDIYKIIDPYMRDKGIEGEIARKARNNIKELSYIAPEIGDYYYHQSKLLKELDDIGVTVDDVSEYAEQMRIMTERQGMPNPQGLGIDPSRDLLQLQTIKERVGEENYNKMVDSVEEFIDNRMERIVERAEESKRFSSEQIDNMKNNRYYFTFVPIQYGDQSINAEIMPQYGTVSPVSNVIIETLFKDAALLSSINIMEGKHSLVAAMKHFAPDQIIEAPTYYDKNTGMMVPEKPQEKGMSMINYLRDGKLEAYYVPQAIADVFKHEPYVANTFVRALDLATRASKEAMVSRNVGWMVFNMPRDFINTIMNNPEIKVRDIPKLMWSYGSAFREAWQEVQHGERSQDISDMYRHKMIPLDRIYHTKESSSYGEIAGLRENLLVDLGKIEPKEYSKAVGAMKKLWDWAGDIGQTTELTSKLVGYKFLRENSDLLLDDLANRVRERVGTPNFKEKGKWHGLTNSLFLFSTIRKQGWVASLDSLKDDPKNYIWKMIIVSVLPKLVQVALENADKLFPESELAQKTAETYDGMSSYLKENYLSIANPWSSVSGKSHGIFLPQEGPNQLVSGLIYNIAKGDLSGVTKTVTDELPWNRSNLNPWLSLGLDAITYVQGENIYDYWRGGHVFSQEAMEFGGSKKLLEFAGYEFSQIGGSAIVNQNIKYADNTVEALLNITPFSAFGRFYRITDAGHQEDISKIYEMRDRAQLIKKKFDNEMRLYGESSIPIDEIIEADRISSETSGITTQLADIRKQIQMAEDAESKREYELLMINIVREYLGKNLIE